MNRRQPREKVCVDPFLTFDHCVLPLVALLPGRGSIGECLYLYEPAQIFPVAYFISTQHNYNRNNGFINELYACMLGTSTCDICGNTESLTGEIVG